MSPPGWQKMSATPCNRNAEESFPVLSLKSREQKPPHTLLIQDNNVLQPRLRLKPEVPEDDIARRAVRLRYTAAGSSTPNDMILSPASLNTVHATGQDPR